MGSRNHAHARAAAHPEHVADEASPESTQQRRGPQVVYRARTVRLGGAVYRIDTVANGYFAVIDVERGHPEGYFIVDEGRLSWAGKTVGLVARAWVRYCSSKALDVRGARGASGRLHT